MKNWDCNMVRKKKITVETDNSDWQAPKKRKPRKPMSEEQRVAASERLVKAREKRKEKNPDYGQSGIAESLRDLPEDHPRHPKKVKEWIKTQKGLANSARSSIRQNLKGAVSQLSIHEGYIRHMKKYLRDGDWVDDFYGEHQENKITRRCTAQGYYWYGPKKGEPKFDIGVYYPYLGCVYTLEMFEEDNPNVEKVEKKNVRRKRRSKKT